MYIHTSSPITAKSLPFASPDAISKHDQSTDIKHTKVSNRILRVGGNRGIHHSLFHLVTEFNKQSEINYLLCARKLTGSQKQS